ncbi:hypothetical protein E8E15_007923 [Penicillium rubens]|jgi:hypothetical protein|uniref:C2H2-type domain-containing protein n=1 Tax=Penicillium chrysogenum TaxID=5076 RepID=A0A161ZM41_PENCH|nr:uncharacterized protein N7525_010537 [Penicillium rubens]KAF3021317.1 hypothetical protein E8E15_007923 [Penicillium rubens]KAJ5036225.1 Zinc finger protein plagl1 [Penicillium rubens]KAJ5821253.1 hypothetical protein N7525_010537 [Penicillium rubens]KZN93547.1 hypothetical protein EN45_037250 [Penicillium chrysogenum]
MAPDQSKQQTSRSLDETQPSPNRFASEELNSMAWSKWIGCVYNPDLTATEFLERWNQAYKHTRAHLMSLDTDIPNTIQYWQFLEAVHSHPDLEQWYPDVDWESKEAISMDQVRSQFLEVAIKIPARKRVVALVARSSSGSRMEKDDYLLWSLEWTKLFYEKIYGKIQSECRFLTFVQSSNTPLRPTGEVSSFFASLRNEVEEYEGELLIVVNGWDGLTTDRMSFYNLFSHWAERITLRIYSQESIWQRKKFFEVNVAQVCSVFRGEIEFDIEDLNNDFSLKDSTALFIRRFSAIPLIKEDISVVSTELRALTNVRNEQPESRNLSKHICGDCNIPFPTSVDLNRHMHHKHEKHENPEMDLRCKFCGYLFSRKDHRDRHVKETCPQNRPKQTLACEIVIDTPCLLKEGTTVARECSAGLQVPPPDQQTLAKQEPPAKKLKRCRGGSKVRFLPPEALPKGSDNGILSYYQLTERHARHLPRLELNPENLNGMEKDIVYKGELFCRYPKCEHFKRYSQPTKLRTHYEQSHRFRYQASSPGHLNKFDEHLHAEGIEWLARWAQLGQDEAGERPIPTRK